jgi:TAP-like protein
MDVLLTYNGDGHTAYGRGSTCIDRAVEDDYLVQGTVPAPGTVCKPARFRTVLISRVASAPYGRCRCAVSGPHD